MSLTEPTYSLLFSLQHLSLTLPVKQAVPQWTWWSFLVSNQVLLGREFCFSPYFMSIRKFFHDPVEFIVYKLAIPTGGRTLHPPGKSISVWCMMSLTIFLHLYHWIRKRKEWDVYEPIVDLLSVEEVEALEAREERNARWFHWTYVVILVGSLHFYKKKPRSQLVTFLVLGIVWESSFYPL